MSQTASIQLGRPTAPDLIFKDRVAKAKMKGLMTGFYAASLASCFLPISLTTPMGYMSLVDIVIILWFPFAIVGALVDDVTINRGAGILLLCLVAFGAVVSAQLWSGHLSNISPIIKYAVFLVLAPISCQFSNLDSDTLEGKLRPSRVVAYAGSYLAFMVLFKIATGQARGSGDVYYVIMFGGAIQKNWIGALLTTSVIATMIEWSYGRGKYYLWLAYLQLLAVLIIGARGSTLGSAIAACMIYLFLNPRGFKGVGKRVTLLAIVGVLASVMVVVFFSGQLARLQELQQTDTRKVNASNSRLLLWAFAIDKIARSPFIGWGYDTFHYVGVGWLNGMYEPHNWILQITYANGVIGFSIFLMIIILSMMKNQGVTTRFVRIACFIYLAEKMVDIIWTRGDGHLFWLLLFTNAFSSRTSKAAGDMSTEQKAEEIAVNGKPKVI